MASAQSATEGSGLVEKIAQKFNLDKAEVQKVFDEERTEHQAEHQQNMQERLATAVKDGKITQAQADLITAKHKELQTQREANKEEFKDKTQEERKAEMEKHRTEIQQWITDNNIPEGYFMGPGGGHGMGRGGPRD